jgi:hypothetical protein
MIKYIVDKKESEQYEDNYQCGYRIEYRAEDIPHPIHFSVKIELMAILSKMSETYDNKC